MKPIEARQIGVAVSDVHTLTESGSGVNDRHGRGLKQGLS